MNKEKTIGKKNGSSAEFLITLHKDIADDLSITLGLRDAVHVLLNHLLRIDDFFGGAVFIVKQDGSLQFESSKGLPIDFEKSSEYFSELSPEALLAVNQEHNLFTKNKSKNEFLVFESVPEATSFITAPVKLNREIVALLILVSNKKNTPAKIITETVEAVSAKIGGVIGRIDSENLLREHQGNLESLFAGVGDMLFIVNAEGRIIHFNPITPQKLGYTEEELSNIHLSQIHPSELSFDVKNMIEKALLGKPVLALFPFVSSTGELIPAETTYSLGKWDSKDMLFLVVRDLRERKIAQEEITIARKRAEEANKAKTVFLANMSHAFRIPMNSIIGMSELLLKTDLTKKQFNFLNVIIKSAENLMVIVNDLLDISKIESGEMQIQKQTFSVKDVLSAVINSQYYNVRYKGVELLSDFVVYSDDYIVKGDSVRLNQILLNLVENAIKNTDKGKVEITVGLKSENADSYNLQFDVIDTGVGINPEKMQEIMGSFTDNRPISSETSNGSGLGLVISNKLIELMGGKLQITSKSNVGSTFSFSIKLEKGSEIELNQTNILDDKNEAQSMDNIHVLLAEDQVFNQMVVQSMVEDWGFDIEIAENGEEVLQKMKTKKYDVILMDIQMPVMDGVEATKKIRNELEAPFCDTPIIAITANAYSDNHRKYIEAGMNDTICKPFKSQILFHKIANTLGMSKSNFLHPTVNFSDIDSMLMPKEEQLFDLSVLKGISKDNQQTINKMLTVFMEKASEEMSQLKVSASEKNWQHLTAIAHKMKPALAYLGMKSLESKINEIQINARNQNEIDKMPIQIQNAEQLLSKIMIQLKKEIN